MRNSRSSATVMVVCLGLLLAQACAPAAPPAPPATAPAAAPAATAAPAAAWAVPVTSPLVSGRPDPNGDPLKAQVDAGTLPPLNQRLPDTPLVVNLREGIGKYGGTLNTAIFPPEAYFRTLLYDPPVRWKEDYSGYTPGWAEKWDYSADGKTVTFTIRSGLKWSDGQPFTTDDILFAWIDLALYPNSGYRPLFWMLNADGTPMEVTAASPTQFSFTFKEPRGTIPDQLAQGYWENAFWMKPKHFLSQFHPKYTPTRTDFSTLLERDDFVNTPGYPTLSAWVTTEYRAGERIVLERNPYYWQVDPQGHQLPYIDKIIAQYVNDDQVRLLKTLQGEFDVLWRGVGALELPTLIKNQDKGNYRVLRYNQGSGAWPAILINQNFEGSPAIHNLLRDKRFRQALSMAIDRDNINDSIWKGTGTPQQGTITRESPHFAGPDGQKLFAEWQQAHAAYDPDAASQMLDQVGLDKKGSDGFRLGSDGQPLDLVLDITAGGGNRQLNAQAAELVRTDWAAVGIKATLNDVPPAQEAVRARSAQWMFSFSQAAELDVWTFPSWVFPTADVRMWPRVGAWFSSGGKQGEAPAPGSPEERLLKIYKEGLTERDATARNQLIAQAVRIHIEEGPFYIGTVGGLPSVVIARPTLKNVPPNGVIGPSADGTPGNLNITTMYWDK